MCGGCRVNYIYRFTGNPFVDAGIAALCAINKKADPQTITKDDLSESIGFISNCYPNWRKLGNFFTQNCLPRQPSLKMTERKSRYREYLEQLWDGIVPISTSGDCGACGGRKAENLVYRHQYPLTGSGHMVNYFSFFELGFPLCDACIFAVQFAPLYIISNKDRILKERDIKTSKIKNIHLPQSLFLVHTHRKEIMLDLAQRSLYHLKGNIAKGEEPSFHTPFPIRDRYECIVKLVSERIVPLSKAYLGPTSIRLYSFTNSGQANNLDFIDLPAEVFSFIENAIKGKGLNRELGELFANSGRGIYRRLVEGESIRNFFLSKKGRKVYGGWDLFELYIKEVEEMKEEKIEAIKSVGQRLYQYLKSTNFKRLKDLELAEDNYTQFRSLLTKIQKENLIWEIDEYSLLFPGDEEGIIQWRETKDILLGYIYGQMHKDGINPKEV